MSSIPQHATTLKAREKGALRRTHCVSVRVNASEFAHLSAWAATERKKCGQLVREITFGSSPKLIPENNHARWEEHARTLANLNQIAWHLNSGRLTEDIRPTLHALLDEVHSLRAELRGEEPADDR